MNYLLLFIFLSLNLVSSNMTTGTVVEMKLMSAKMLRNTSSNQNTPLKNDNVVIISEQLTGISQVLIFYILIQ